MQSGTGSLGQAEVYSRFLNGLYLALLPFLPIAHRQYLFYGVLGLHRKFIFVVGKTYFRRRSFGTSLDNLGTSSGFANCCVLEGREVYGRSSVVALHS